LYKNKAVAIVSENEEGEEEARFLSEICSKVYYLPLYKTSFEEINGIEVIKAKPISVIGNENRVTSLSTSKGNIDVDAVFFIRNVLPVNQLLEGLELEDGSIKVDRLMATSIPGVYACGDCAGKPFQISKAVGEGSTAALSAVKYLDSSVEVK
jgi:thioredoxin reductase (NADPH)